MTDRTEVLRLLVQGLTNKEIAVRLDVSESTVKNILQQLFAKSTVRTRSQLVRVALGDLSRSAVITQSNDNRGTAAWNR